MQDVHGVILERLGKRHNDKTSGGAPLGKAVSSHRETEPVRQRSFQLPVLSEVSETSQPNCHRSLASQPRREQFSPTVIGWGIFLYRSNA